MNALTTPDHISAQTLETVLGTGNLAQLTTQQRVEYYAKTCASIGLNPLTRPFRFMNFQGQTVMYATRDCSDQLRATRDISVQITDKSVDGDLFIVTARASAKGGRQDEDIGAVTMNGLKGEARANAMMKAMTKAKRRVTLSICGLGFLDESEVATLHGATTYEAEAEAPAQTALPRQPTPKPQPQPTLAEELGDSIPDAPEPAKRPFGEYLRDKLAASTTPHEVAALRMDPRIQPFLTSGPPDAVARAVALIEERIEALMPGMAKDAPPAADEGSELSDTAPTMTEPPAADDDLSGGI
jgi:hypothetical protein